jgi:hypothetical protein
MPTVMSDHIRRLADEFEDKIRKAGIDEATRVMLVVKWAGGGDRINREPIDATVQTSLGSPELDRRWRADLRTATLIRNMRRRVMALADDHHPEVIREVGIEFVPESGHLDS